MMPLSILIPVGAIALSLLVGYGLLEFVGVYMEPIMRPILKHQVNPLSMQWLRLSAVIP